MNWQNLILDTAELIEKYDIGSFFIFTYLGITFVGILFLAVKNKIAKTIQKFKQF